eukprot:scaffold102657_cov22-Tisochrysis_lutea.AAC.1
MGPARAEAWQRRLWLSHGSAASFGLHMFFPHKMLLVLSLSLGRLLFLAWDLHSLFQWDVHCRFHGTCPVCFIGTCTVAPIEMLGWWEGEMRQPSRTALSLADSSLPPFLWVGLECSMLGEGSHSLLLRGHPLQWPQEPFRRSSVAMPLGSWLTQLTQPDLGGMIVLICHVLQQLAVTNSISGRNKAANHSSPAATSRSHSIGFAEQSHPSASSRGNCSTVMFEGAYLLSEGNIQQPDPGATAP